MHASFTGAAGSTIAEGEFIYYNTSDEWDIGTSGGAYVTLNTTQEITGEKTISAPIHLQSFDTTGNGSVTGTFEVTGPTTLESTLLVEGNTALGNASTDTVSVVATATFAEPVICSTSTTVTSSGSSLITKDYLDAIFPDFSDGDGATFDGRFLNVAGDNMTGDLTLGTDKITLDATNGSATFASDITPTTDGGANLGSTSNRFSNVYTQDMHLSNEGTEGNSVDGTTGDWTLQEGAENIYLINNKTGSKFKISMEAV